MKEEKTKYNTTESRIQSNIQDVEPGKLIFIENRKVNGPAIPNYPTFGGISGKLCTGPPGRARSPGEYSPVRAEPKTDQIPVLSGHPLKANYALRHRSLSLSKGNTEYQVFSNNNKNHFFQTLNFKIMKKQILIIAFFVLALMAGSLSSFGQVLTHDAGLPALVGVPLPLTACPSDALHPLPGQPYVYAITNPNGAIVAADTYTWWATKDQTFVDATNLNGKTSTMLTTASNDLVAVGAGYGLPTAATPSMSITWSADILSKTKYQAVGADAPKTSTFVSVLATGGTGCTNNLQVYEINPLPAFTLDITNVDKAGVAKPYGTDVPQCVDQVRTAAYAVATHDVLMDYGTNVLIFEVIAANFVTSWVPTFTIGTNSLSTVVGKTQTADISWYSTLAGAQTGVGAIETKPGLADAAVTAGVTPLTVAAGTNTANGVSLYVRVVIHNQKFESIVDNPFVLKVDGKDATNQWDLNNTAAAATCAVAGVDGLDAATQTITKRPDIQSNPNPASAVGTPADWVPKN